MMLIKEYYLNVLWLLAAIFVLYSVECIADDESDSVYIAGFIKDNETNDEVSGAIVVVTHDHKKIFSVRSVQGGWFETLTPLDKAVLSEIKDSTNHKTKITILKRGYYLYENDVIINNNQIMFDIKLTRIKGVVSNNESTTYPTSVKYGYVYNNSSQLKEPVKGAVIVIEKKSNDDPSIVSSAVTRDSGYFSLYYPKKEENNNNMQYTLEHYQHNTEHDSISLDGKNELSIIPITQDKFSFSIGLGLHLQSVSLFDKKSLKETGDLETGGALSLNMAWYPNEHVVVNGFLPRYKKTGIVGGEFTIGVIPYRETKTGKDEVGETYVIGLGLVYAIRHSPFQLRMGLTRSDTDKNAIYVGINVPFIFF